MKKIFIILFCVCYVGVLIVGSNASVNNSKNDFLFVKATMYTIDPKQTDASPLVTASGFNLDPKNPKKHKIIAVSRDLIDSLGFGKRVRIENAGKYDGIYYVEDVMNRRFKKRIDILINPKEKAISIDSVKLSVLN
jgi:3D (Asp-Asp-Asp) domain-containing protein